MRIPAYSTFIDYIETEFPHFKESEFYDFTRHTKDLIYSYTGIFAQYINKLIEEDVTNKDLEKVTTLINLIYNQEDAKLRELIGVEFFESWGGSKKTISYGNIHLKGEALETFTKIINWKPKYFHKDHE